MHFLGVLIDVGNDNSYLLSQCYGGGIQKNAVFKMFFDQKAS